MPDNREGRTPGKTGKMGRRWAERIPNSVRTRMQLGQSTAGVLGLRTRAHSALLYSTQQQLSAVVRPRGRACEAETEGSGERTMLVS